MAEEREHDSLTLKWGTLKGWHLHSARGLELLKRYHEIGACTSVALQNDTPEQKQLICEMIDECDDPEGIYLDWDDKYVSKDEAKHYVMTYGSNRDPAP